MKWMLRKVESAEDPVFSTLVDWQYEWWGASRGLSREAVAYWASHCLESGKKLPQTFAALDGEEPVGMFQITGTDDLFLRPDLYPWLANVYVPPQRRGQGIGRAMLEQVPSVARSLGLKELYLYTHHRGLYEKFGWEKRETIPSFTQKPPDETVFRLAVEEN